MKSVKNLIVPFVIFIALCIFAAVYFIADGISRKKAVAGKDEFFTALSISPSDISTLTVKNNESGYTSVINCSKDQSGSVICEFKGDDFSGSERYSQTKMLSVVSGLSTFYSEHMIKAVDNLAEYGLDAPRFNVTIVSNEGTTNLFLGNRTPDEQSCYMYIEGSNDVYTVDILKLSYAGSKGIDFLEAMTFDIDYNEVRTVHFDRRTDGLSLDANVSVGKNCIASFELNSPYKHGTSGYFGTLFDTLSKLVVDDFVAVDFSNLSEYGLDTPAYHFVFNMADGSKTEFFFSKPQNGYYYGFTGNSGKYFRLSEFTLTGIDNAETVLIDPYICYCYVKDYTTITGTYQDKSFKLDLDVPEGQSITSDNASVSLDGRNAKINDSFGRSYCSILFESIACIKIGGVEIAEKTKPSAAAELSLTFIDKNYVTTVYEFYPKGTDSYYVFKNGEYMNFYVFATEIFNDGGTDTYSYGYWRAYELLNQAITDNMNGIYDL